MERDLFAYLPSETMIDILSRVSVRGIALSKCVCKAWLDLLGSDEFVSCHHSKSAATLAVSRPYGHSYPCKLFDELDDLDLENQNPITKFDFPHRATFEGSASADDGLIFLRNYWGDTPLKPWFDAVYVCNPITREFINIPFPEGAFLSDWSRIGFGASKVAGEHKVVRISYESEHHWQCHVYTLGTGQWRRVEIANGFGTTLCDDGTFVNGILYWRVIDSGKTWISCFDLETEHFSTVSPPPVPVRGGETVFNFLSFRDCLCAVDNEGRHEIVLWLLKECGAEKKSWSWRKEYVIDQNPDYDEQHGFYSFKPIKVFKNGDILVLCDENTFFRYSIKGKTYQEIPSFGGLGIIIKSLLLTPSFRSLKRSFGTENVISF